LKQEEKVEIVSLQPTVTLATWSCTTEQVCVASFTT